MIPLISVWILSLILSIASTSWMLWNRYRREDDWKDDLPFVYSFWGFCIFFTIAAFVP